MTVLLGRETERRRIDDAFQRARATLLLVGEPGIGKSALLDHAAERVSGMQVLVLVGAPHQRSQAPDRTSQRCAAATRGETLLALERVHLQAAVHLALALSQVLAGSIGSRGRR